MARLALAAPVMFGVLLAIHQAIWGWNWPYFGLLVFLAVSGPITSYRRSRY